MEKMLTRKEIFLIIGVAVVIILVGAIVWLVFDYSTKNKEESSKKKTAVAQQCGDLVAEKGLATSAAPFTPKLKAKITGDYDKTKAVCQWTINNVPIPNTYTVLGECVFGGRSFSTVGEYRIVYKVDGLSGCPKSATITVK